MMLDTAPRFTVTYADSASDVLAAQRLRYAVFVEEMGGGGAMVDHAARTESDPFDAHSDHLLLRDLAAPDPEAVVGVYRVMTQGQARAAGGFYTASEFDLDPLIDTGTTLLELGRSCLAQDYRGGGALLAMWQGLAQHIAKTGAELLFGTASFPGTDPARHRPALSLLGDAHLAPAAIRPRAIGPGAVPLVTGEPDSSARKAALRGMPPLIKSYLRVGGTVGEGAYIDRAFNTIDVCMVLDTREIPARQRILYGRGT